MKRLYSVFILILFCSLDVLATNDTLLIQNVTVIPTHINQQLKNKDVIVEQGIITKIRNHKKNDTIGYTQIINGTGKFLISSFSDAHAHLPKQKELKRYFLLNLLNGVTTLRSMRGEPWHVKIDKDEVFTPRLILGSPPVSWRDTIYRQKAEKLIKEYKNNGFDFLKILSVKDEPTFNYLVENAQEYAFHIAGHCPSNIGIVKVCNSDVYKSIEHLGGFFRLKGIEQINEAIDLSISKEIYHCATMDWYYIGQVPEDELRKRKGVKYLPSNWVNKWEDKIKDHFAKTSAKERDKEKQESQSKFQQRTKYLRYLYQQGAKLLLSPDASGLYGIPGFGVHTEMEHYFNADISNYDILKIASYNLSKMQSTENQWGSIRVGATSDMVLLDANPLKNIENTKSINGIIFKGRFYSKQHLLNEINALMN